LEAVIEIKPGIATCGTNKIAVDEGSNIMAEGVKSSCVGVELGMEVFVFCPIRVGVTVKVGVGTVGVKVDASVGVFVKNVEAAVAVTCIPKNSLTVMEQAESSTATISRMEFFFMYVANPL
jgi:hypothetical protein